MKIQELADRMGLTIHTLRYYEKEGLLDERHVRRESNHYRCYSEQAIERLKMIKKFQGIGCSLGEMKALFREQQDNGLSHQQIIDWILAKINDIARKQEAYAQMLVTLNWMLDYRTALMNDPPQAQAMLKAWHAMQTEH